jgi:uncharacterized delta-60 repeat protein
LNWSLLSDISFRRRWSPMKIASIGLLLLHFVFTCSQSALATPGSLDPTFGNGGSVFATIPALNPDVHGLAIQPDGKILMAGTTFGPDSTQDFAVARLNPDGSVDTSFGTNGIVAIPFDNFADEYARAVGIQSDGKIIVAGHVQFGSPGWDFGVVRLNANGTIDTSFGIGGKVKVNIGGNDFVNDMILQPDGKIVITGTMRPTPNTDVPVVRLTADGALDTTFNGTGKVFVAIGEGINDGGNALALQPDGKILVVGYSGSNTLLFRLRSNGTLDIGDFGAFGIRLIAIGANGMDANSTAIQADGKIVIGGSTFGSPFRAVIFARFAQDGSLDTSFGNGGSVSIDVRPSQSDFCRSVLIQSDGKIIGVGASGGNYILVRLNPNGSLDNEFGTGGKVAVNVAPAHSGASRAVLQPDGKVLAVGDGSSIFAVGFTAARFLTAAQNRAMFDFDGDGKTDAGVYRPGAGEWWVLRSSAGLMALQFGAETDVIVPGDFTGDGKADIAFWRPTDGTWYILRSEDSLYYAFSFGSDGDIPVPGDFDGDGKTDAAVFRPADGLWFILRSSDEGVTIHQFGAAGDRPVVADYDGDGRDDIAVYRPNGQTGGEWWVNRSTDGLMALTFGTAADKTVPADYTGDGKADIAFWRPSNGHWYVLRSDTLLYYAFPFGTTGDIPAPGDYDGDGQTDAAVFRPSSATWFVQRSTGGTDIFNFGVTGDQPVSSAFVR